MNSKVLPRVCTHRPNTLSLPSVCLPRQSAHHAIHLRHWIRVIRNISSYFIHSNPVKESVVHEALSANSFPRWRGSTRIIVSLDPERVNGGNCTTKRIHRNTSAMWILRFNWGHKHWRANRDYAWTVTNGTSLKFRNNLIVCGRMYRRIYRSFETGVWCRSSSQRNYSSWWWSMSFQLQTTWNRNSINCQEKARRWKCDHGWHRRTFSKRSNIPRSNQGTSRGWSTHTFPLLSMPRP